MNRLATLKITNVLLLCTFVGQVGTGAGHELMGHKAFEIVHPSLGGVLTVLVLIHLTLNWGWVKNTFFKSS
jgi:hypothetical protein